MPLYRWSARLLLFWKRLDQAFPDPAMRTFHVQECYALLHCPIRSFFTRKTIVRRGTSERMYTQAKNMPFRKEWSAERRSLCGGSAEERSTVSPSNRLPPPTLRIVASRVRVHRPLRPYRKQCPAVLSRSLYVSLGGREAFRRQ